MATPIHEKRPRDYVAEIIALPTREERREALARVPEHLSLWVEDSVRNYFELKKAQRPQSNAPANGSPPPKSSEAKPKSSSVKNQRSVDARNEFIRTAKEVLA